MATTKMTFGNILKTVSSTANTVTTAVDGLNTGAGMFGKYMDKIAYEQSLTHKAEGAQFKERLIQRMAQEETDSVIEILNYCNKSESHASQYKSSYDKFSKLLNQN